MKVRTNTQTVRSAFLAAFLVSAIVGVTPGHLAAAQSNPAATENPTSPERDRESSGAADWLAAAGEMFASGDPVAARTEYLRQVEQNPSSTVFYNLGRVEHALGQSPQAVLWYRRALRLAPNDPWAQENITRLRADLGVASPDPWQPLAVLARTAKYSGWLTGTLVWLCVMLRWLAGRPNGWALATAATLLLASHLGLQLAETVAPVDGVLMTDCQAGSQSLPAGSEVWISRTNPSKVWATSGSFSCAPESIIRVDSQTLPVTSTYSDSTPEPSSVESPELALPASDSDPAPPFV